MNKKTLILLFVIILLPYNLFAVDPVLIDDALSRYHFGRSVEYLEDKEKKLSIDDAIAEGMNWQQSPKESLNFGFTDSAYWLRFTVNNTLEYDREWYLEIAYPMIDYIDLYIPQESGEFIVKKGGDHYPFKKREINYRNFIFQLFENLHSTLKGNFF